MLESTTEYNIQTIISIIGGIVLFASELLPFIKSVKSNGIVELLINAGKRYITKSNLNERNLDDIERSPLLNDIERNIERDSDDIERNLDGIERRPINNIERSPLINGMEKLNININNMFQTLTNYINETQNSRQLKLQSIEIYELNYIINYIKVHYPKKMFQTKFLSQVNKQLLISQGYTIDYDSLNDTHTIKW